MWNKWVGKFWVKEAYHFTCLLLHATDQSCYEERKRQNNYICSIYVPMNLNKHPGCCRWILLNRYRPVAFGVLCMTVGKSHVLPASAIHKPGTVCGASNTSCKHILSAPQYTRSARRKLQLHLRISPNSYLQILCAIDLQYTGQFPFKYMRT